MGLSRKSDEGDSRKSSYESSGSVSDMSSDSEESDYRRESSVGQIDITSFGDS